MRWVDYLFAALYLVWLLNLTNFMDGIDGIAALKAVTVCVGGHVAMLGFTVRTHGMGGSSGSRIGDARFSSLELAAGEDICG